MNVINEFFTFIGKMIPFATDFFGGTFAIGTLEISNLFAILVAFVLLLVVVIIAIAASGRNRGGRSRVPKSKGAKTPQPQTQISPTQPQQEESEYLQEIPAPRTSRNPHNADVAVYSGISEQAPVQEPVEEIVQTEEQSQESAVQPEALAETTPATVVETEDADTSAPVPELVDIELPEQPTDASEQPEDTTSEDISTPPVAEQPRTAEMGDDATEAEQPTDIGDVDAVVETTEQTEVDEQVADEVETIATEADEALVFDEEPTADGTQENTEVVATEEVAELPTESLPEQTETADETETVSVEQADAPTELSPQENDADIMAFDEDTTEAQQPTEVLSMDQQDAPSTVDVNRPETETATATTPAKKKENKPTKEEPMKDEKEKKAPKKADANVVGKFEISLAIDGYRFCLYANNGQLMYESVGFVSIEGCKKGIETFRKTLREMPYSITRDKRGRYRFVFNKKYQGETYPDKASATRAAESVKRWGADAKVVVNFPTDEELHVYQERLNAMRDKSDVDWDAVAKEEAAIKKSGKFVIEAEMNGDEIYGYRFYLLANNAQILYTSALYANPATATSAIDAFKRAVYIGNFYIDEDKTGHFRYILRGNNITYVGESYTSKTQAEKSVDSVKNFVKSAQLIPYTPDND